MRLKFKFFWLFVINCMSFLFVAHAQINSPSKVEVEVTGSNFKFELNKVFTNENDNKAVALYKSGTHVVLIVNMEEARIHPLLASKNNDGMVRGQPLEQFYQSVNSYQKLVAVVSGAFGIHVKDNCSSREPNTIPYEALPFPYKSDGVVDFLGLGYEKIHAQKALMLENKSADVIDFPSDDTSDEAFTQFMTPYHNLIGSMNPDDGADKSPDRNIGRNFFGVRNNGKELVIVISDHSSVGWDGMEINDAKQVLISFSVAENQIVMFDDSGSAQAIIEGKTVLSGDNRCLTNVFYIQALSPEIPPPSYSCYFSYISDNYAEKSILTLCGLGVIEGYGDGTFRPNIDVTRAEFLKMALLANPSHKMIFRKWKPTFLMYQGNIGHLDISNMQQIRISSKVLPMVNSNQMLVLVG